MSTKRTPIEVPNGAPALFKIIPVIIILIILALVLKNAFVIVKPGHSGAKARLGKVSKDALPEGFHFAIPGIDKITQIDIRQNKETSEATAASKDLQTVSTKIEVQYSLRGEMVPLIYQKIGSREVFATTIIDPAIEECLKAVTAGFTAEELVTQRSRVKDQVETKLKEFIQKTLSLKELGACIDIHNIAITDFKFSRQFDAAIEAKVTAEQQALQAKQEKEKIIIQAEAQKERARLEAEARAVTITQESIARAEAIEREAKALRDNPELIQLRTIERWDGVLPKFSGGGTIPLLNIDMKWKIKISHKTLILYLTDLQLRKQILKLLSKCGEMLLSLLERLVIMLTRSLKKLPRPLMLLSLERFSSSLLLLPISHFALM